MKRKPGTLRRLFSLNQHRKRLGAARNAGRDADISAMKARLIEFGEPLQTRGSEKSLDLHLDNLRREFSGQSELLHHHARLIVLLRRGYRTAETFDRFLDLWETEGRFLREELNVRWLVSACDTFAEHHPDPALRAVAAMASLLANTVKIQETEHSIASGCDLSPDPARIADLQTGLVPLFEGMSCFTVGTDDTLRNLSWRLQPFFEMEPVGPILQTIWNRFQTNDTAFARLRALHRRDRTSWWTE